MFILNINNILNVWHYICKKFTCRHIYSANEKVKRNHLEKMDLI